jgi:hypothetical protein
MSQNSYPFTSRAQMLVRINAEPDFAIEAVRMIDARRAWMASHRARAAKLIAKLDAGAPTSTDQKEASALAARYSKTLARILREKALADRPELAAIGAVFGVVPGGAVGSSDVVAVPSPVVAPVPAKAPPAPETTPSERVPVPKRRLGRPPGSRNKIHAKDEPRLPRKRRSRG